MNLILTHKGTEVSIYRGLFTIKNKTGTHRLAPEKIKSMVLAVGIRISSNAMLMAIENEIDILLVDETGHPQGRIWSHKFGSISSLRRKQLEFAESKRAGAWLLDVQRQQARARIHLLKFWKEKTSADISLEPLESLLHQLNQLLPQIPDKPFLQKLRNREAQLARVYYRMLSDLLPSEFQFSKRSRPALDPANSCLNYLYGMLYAKVELVLLQAGLDPYLGIFHRDQYNRPAMVYDQIELYRPWAEEVLLDLCLGGKLTSACFVKRKGSLWLNESGKQLAIPAMFAFLADSPTRSGNARESIMLLDARQLARTITPHKKPHPETE